MSSHKTDVSWNRSETRPQYDEDTYHSFYGSEPLFSQAGSILKVFDEGLVHPVAASVEPA